MALPPPTKPEDVLPPLNAIEKKYLPSELYLLGHRHLLRDTLRVSIIGSRSASAADLGEAASLARQLATEGVVVVSGLARGIDTAAHLAAIDEVDGGRTIAVIGTPLTKAYPRENEALQVRIAREHLLVSQFATSAGRAAFPMRNRTMALLSHASIIVAAGEKSGTQHQGWEALRMGRPLFLGRSVIDAGLTWVEKMLDHGAQPLEGLAEVLDAIPSLDALDHQASL